MPGPVDKDKDLFLVTNQNITPLGTHNTFRSLPRLVISLASIPNLVCLSYWVHCPSPRMFSSVMLFSFWCHCSKPKRRSPSCPCKCSTGPEAQSLPSASP